MVTLRMVDMSNPSGFDPSAAQAAGVWGVAGYIGGETPYTWTAADWERCVVSPGMRVALLVWVPPQDPSAYTTSSAGQWAEQAVNAASVAWSAGVPETAAIILDIEAPMVGPGSNDACQAWTTVLEETNRANGVYGPPSAFPGWPATPEVAWVAEWPGTYGPDQWPTSATPATGLAPVTAWQFEGGGMYFNCNCDRSVITLPSLPPRIGAPTSEPEPSAISAIKVRQALGNIQQTLSDAERELGL